MDFNQNNEDAENSFLSPYRKSFTQRRTLNMKPDFKRSHIYLNAILKNVPDIVYQLNPQGQISYINDAIAQYGYRQSELIGQNILDIVHPEDRNRAYYNIRERRSGKRRTHSMEIRLLTKNQLKTVKQAHPIKENGNGSRIFLLEAEGLYDVKSSQNRTFLGTQGIARDITGSRRTVQELVRLRSVVEKMDAWVLIINSNGQITFVNDAFVNDIGQQFDQIEGQSIYELPPLGEVDLFIEQFKDAIEKLSANSEPIHVSKEKNLYEGYEASFFPISDSEGNIFSYAAIKQKNAYKTFSPAHLQKAQKMEAVGLMAGGIAHDFNNLLTVINGYAELILAQISENNPLYHYIEQILKGGQHARDMIRQLLAFSRKQIIDPRIVQLNEIISDNTDIFKRLIGADIEMDISLSSRLPRIKADPSQIEQIILNLLVNAREAIFCQQNTSTVKKIRIRTQSKQLNKKFVAKHPGSREGRYVLLSISDTGSGIDNETKEKIFEPFFTTKSDGTGLGLATVYGIVKQNGGCIYVRSSKSKGTTFDIYWPATRKQIEIKQEEGKIQATLKGNETILIVEDNENVRKFTVSALRLLGYTVYSAENGQEALQIVKKAERPIDLLVVDAVMPKMSGRELADKVSKHLPSLQVLFTSGYTNTHIVQRGRLVKGVNFIEKPYTGNSLAQKIRAIFDTN